MHEKLSALELAQEMLDGLEGVTPGPWFAHGPIKGAVRRIAWVGNASTPYTKTIDESAANAAHIARCSPENIALLCRALLAERKPKP